MKQSPRWIWTLLAVVACGVLLTGVLIVRSRMQHIAELEAIVESAGGQVTFGVSGRLPQWALSIVPVDLQNSLFHYPMVSTSYPTGGPMLIDDDAWLAIHDQLAPFRDEIIALYFRDTDLGDVTAATCLEYPNLFLVDFGGTQITDAGLNSLSRHKGITSIILDHTDITDAGVASLERLPNLYALRLTDTSVTENAVDALKAKHSRAILVD